MSLPASRSLTGLVPASCKSPSCPEGPDTARSCVLIFGPAAEQAFTAARNARLAASNAVPSKPVYGFAPLSPPRFQSASKAARAVHLGRGPPCREGLLPERRAPSAASSFRRASVNQRARGFPFSRPNERRRELREGLGEVDDDVPRRTAAHEPACPRVVVRLVRVPAESLPPPCRRASVLRDEELLERGTNASFACAHVDGLTFSKCADRCLREHSSLQVIRRIDAPEVAVVLDARDLRRRLDVGLMSTTRLGIATD